MESNNRSCLYCGCDISHKHLKAKFCCVQHSNTYYNKLKREANDVAKSNRFCEMCGIDISHKNKSARYCSREHKSKHYRFLNREKVKEWKKNWNNSNAKKIADINRARENKERKELGYTKKYLREYANRHMNKLIQLKGKKCFKCGQTNYLEIHHEKYTKDPKDWEFVCENCHRLIHEPTALLK